MENQRKVSLARSLAGQLSFTCYQSLRLLIQTATPLKNINYYRRYFATVEQVTGTGTGAAPSKDRRNIVGLCVVYSLLLAYFALFNAFHFFLPPNFVMRVLLGDVVAALGLDAQFNFIFTLLSFYSIFINWQMYFMVNQKNTAFLKSVFQCLPVESSNQAVSPVLSAAENRKNSNRSTTTTTAEGNNQTKAVLNQQHCLIMQRFVLLAINTLQVFILIIDLCLLVFTPMVVATWLRTQEFITFEHLVTSGVESQDGQLEWRLFLLFFSPHFSSTSLSTTCSG